ETAADEPGDFRNFFLQHLVDDNADDLDAFFFKQRPIERNFVNRFADAALGDDDDLAAECLGDLRVGQIKNRADAGVTAAFAQYKIFFPGDAVESGQDAFDQRFIVRTGEVFTRESRFDGDGTHVHKRAIQPEYRVHQYGILVN